MKLMLTTLNSKFVHSCLSIRYLRGYSRDIIDTVLKEYTINQSIDYIVSEIYKIRPSIIGFSTYIWNKEETLEIAESLKMIMPDIKIFLGGPEVSFDGPELMEENKFIDFIIYGEGEETFQEFINIYVESGSYESVKGLIYRDGQARPVKNPARPLIQDLNTIPSPYDEEVGRELENRIIYYESSRGCPFNCKFCLSSTIKGVRYFDLDRVKRELGILIDAKVRQVKFVDRTFNANKEYAMGIMNYIMDRNPQGINFHFEVTAHLLDEEMLEFLSQVKEGLFQFEVGVQSTNDQVIEAVGRTTDFPKLREVTKRIKSFGKIHQHLDLIAGLPYEDYESFARSFDDVYEIRPEKIQLGFLKLLKGSELRRLEDNYGFKYLDKAPYEVLETDYIDYKHIRRLKAIDNMVDKYYNEEIFRYSLDYLIDRNYSSAFRFFEELGLFFEEKNYHKVKHGRRALYDILREFYQEKDFPGLKYFNEILKLDFVENNKGLKLPNSIDRLRLDISKGDIHELLKNEELLSGRLANHRELPTRELIKLVQIEKYGLDLLDYLETGRIVETPVYIMTLYRDGVINVAESFDVTSLVEKL